MKSHHGGPGRSAQRPSRDGAPVKQRPTLRPKLAILFWHYCRPAVCLSRLRLLRRLNQKMPIYGLYGGRRSASCEFENAHSYLDDIYIYPGDHDSRWKWVNGDLLLLSWYRDRGRHLTFDSIVIVQWDMLLTAPIQSLFKGISYSDVFFSSLRQACEAPPDWHWMHSRSERPVFEEFANHMREHLNYDGALYACEFVIACLSRNFLDAWADCPRPDLGFLEYKLPTYAAAFGCTFYGAPHLDTTWMSWSDPELTSSKLTLTTRKRPVSLDTVEYYRKSSTPRYAFHPVIDEYDLAENSGVKGGGVVARARG